MYVLLYSTLPQSVCLLVIKTLALIAMHLTFIHWSILVIARANSLKARRRAIETSE